MIPTKSRYGTLLLRTYKHNPVGVSNKRGPVLSATPKVVTELAKCHTETGWNGQCEPDPLPECALK